jgi:chorismate--pyruvate lyase
MVGGSAFHTGHHRLDQGASVMAWKTPPAARGGLRRWLQAPGSLSARLAATGEVFSVQVLTQGRQPLTVDEALALGCGAQRAGYVREVLLRVDGKPMVFARSVTAHADSVGAWRAMRGLGSRPLADVLFRRAGITRQPLSFTQLKPQSPLQRQVSKAWHAAAGTPIGQAPLPARRSVFTRHGAALLVMEVFAASAPQWPWPEGTRTSRSPHRRQT